MKYLQIRWRNYQGIVEIRNVIPQSKLAKTVEFTSYPGIPDHPTDHYFLHTYDLDRDATRIYELGRIENIKEIEEEKYSG